jgi:RNA polymerase sigma-70 factor (ECF subfamily)
MGQMDIDTHRNARETTPEQWLRAYRKSGDPAALGALFDACAPGLFRVALAISGDAAAAEDAVQETFLAVLAGAHGSDLSRPVRPWLVRILRNKLVDARRRSRRRVDPFRLAPKVLPADPGTEAERAEMIERVRAEIDRLPPPYRAVALLCWEYGLTPGEIAHVRRESPGTVRSTLSRALGRLRRALAGATAILVVLGIRPRTGLTAVRKTVLAQAASASLAAPGFLRIGGAFVSHTTAAVILCATFLAGGVAGGIAFPAAPPESATVAPRPEPSPPDRPSDSAARAKRTRVAVERLTSPDRPGRDLRDRIPDLLDMLDGEWRSAFTVGNLLASFDGAAVLPVLTERWATIDVEDRRQILKAFAFARHPRLLDVMHLGMSDPAPILTNAAAYHLIGVAGRDFRLDLSDYAAWRRENEGRTLREVLLATNLRIADRVEAATPAGMDVLAPILAAHAWKIARLPEARVRLLASVEPWLARAGPDILPPLLETVNELAPGREFFERAVLPRAAESAVLRPIVFVALGRREHAWATDRLVAEVDGADPTTVAAAAGALVGIGDFTVVPRMLAAMRAAVRPDVRSAIESAVEDLVGIDRPGADSASWESWWEQNRKHYDREK